MACRVLSTTCATRKRSSSNQLSSCPRTAGKEAPLAWLGRPQLLPRLRELGLLSSLCDRSNDDEPVKWEAPRFGPSLPPCLTLIGIGGAAVGMRHAAGELHSLEWGPGDDGWLWDMPARGWQAVCRVSPLHACMHLMHAMLGWDAERVMQFSCGSWAA